MSENERRQLYKDLNSSVPTHTREIHHRNTHTVTNQDFKIGTRHTTKDSDIDPSLTQNQKLGKLYAKVQRDRGRWQLPHRQKAASPSSATNTSASAQASLETKGLPLATTPTETESNPSKHRRAESFEERRAKKRPKPFDPLKTRVKREQEASSASSSVAEASTSRHQEAPKTPPRELSKWSKEWFQNHEMPSPNKLPQEWSEIFQETPEEAAKQAKEIAQLNRQAQRQQKTPHLGSPNDTFVPVSRSVHNHAREMLERNKPGFSQDASDNSQCFTDQQAISKLHTEQLKQRYNDLIDSVKKDGHYEQFSNKLASELKNAGLYAIDLIHMNENQRKQIEIITENAFNYAYQDASDNSQRFTDQQGSLEDYARIANIIRAREAWTNYSNYCDDKMIDNVLNTYGKYGLNGFYPHNNCAFSEKYPIKTTEAAYEALLSYTEYEAFKGEIGDEETADAILDKEMADITEARKVWTDYANTCSDKKISDVLTTHGKSGLSDFDPHSKSPFLENYGLDETKAALNALQAFEKYEAFKRMRGNEIAADIELDEYEDRELPSTSMSADPSTKETQPPQSN
jgi:hypothetical protein